MHATLLVIYVRHEPCAQDGVARERGPEPGTHRICAEIGTPAMASVRPLCVEEPPARYLASSARTRSRACGALGAQVRRHRRRQHGPRLAERDATGILRVSPLAVERHVFVP